MSPALYFGFIVANIVGLGCFLAAWTCLVSSQRYSGQAACFWMALAIISIVLGITFLSSSPRMSKIHKGVIIENPLK